MARLFGIDIAATVAAALQGAGGLQAGTLYQQAPDRDSRNPAELTSGVPRAPAATESAFQGIAETKAYRMEDSAVARTVQQVSIVAGSLPAGVVPRVNDKIRIGEGRTCTLVELLALDPAGALYVFRVE